MRTDEIVRAAFAERGWTLEAIPEASGYRAVFTGSKYTWEVYLSEEWDQGLFRVVVLGPLLVPRENLLRVGEFILRINAMIPVGRMDLDFDHATVRWVVSVDISVAPPSPGSIAVLVERGLMAVESMWRELVDLAEARLDPVSAIYRLQLRQVAAGDEGVEPGEITADFVELLVTDRDPMATVRRYREALGPRIELRILNAADRTELYRG